ncbi:uncharacterized protein LOC132939253 isoform X1 [Metopolophium dirhodum]|uniref:uncharacterized protein LOC132939253 isoform X1 n=1 Tax=Metopolophium dirhodum TaxID=44670 RepID=UPI00298FCC45|nr:uncharacterized protein LOC132939253 isoform X1 [Metopolophium dirhodum]
MGCGTSNVENSRGRLRADKELYLPSTELHFNAGQMQRLNDNFLRGYENSDDIPTSSSSLNVEAIVNRIMQRLLCGIGKLDKRFACKYLITAEPMSTSIKLSKSFSYYVRLDVLSEPKMYEDDFDYQVRCVVEEDGVPQGFAKIRLVTNEPEKWADLIDNDGYLRRDKLKLRFVELLAKSASCKSDFVGRPEDVDESYLCGCPGKIVDAGLLHEILKSPADEHVFFGMGSTGSSKFPDPRDLRIAVVEDAQCVKLRISGPKTSGDIAVVLLPAIEFSGWPKYTDVLSRIPLTHPDILIHQQATTMGYYAVPVAPHPTVRCYGRPATFQIRFPAAECLYQTHYSERSVVSNIYHFLRTKVPKLRKGENGVCVVSGYMLKTLLWFRLEACGRVEDWDHRCVAVHVLSVLDSLVAALKAQHHRSYFYPYANVVLNAPRACRTMVSEDDYQNDVEIVEAYMYGLFEKSMGSDSIVTGQAFQNTDADYWQNLESVMLHKWYRVLDTMDPKPRRLDYSRKQVEYIGEVFKGMLATRHCVSTGAAESSSAWHFLTEEKIPRCSTGLVSGDEIGLDAAYLVSVVAEQALAIYGAARDKKDDDRKRRPLRSAVAADKKSGVGGVGRRGRCLAGRQRRRTPSTGGGPEAVRRLLCDVYADATVAEISGDSDLVRFVLGRLQSASVAASATDFRPLRCRRRRVGLGPPLSLFLRQLYDVSHSTCWHLDEWRRRWDRDELRSLGAFARLLCRDEVRPTDALLDAIQKGWSWADKLLLAAVEFQDGVDIVCTPGPGDVQRFSISLSEPEQETFASRSLGRAAERQQRYSARADTVSNKFKTVRGMSFLDADSSLNEKKNAPKTTVASYVRLQWQSPMTATIASNRYRSNHRVLGNIVNALINLQKYTVLQEMCAVLPEDKQGPVLDDIRKISKERRRQRGAASMLASAAAGHGQSAPADGLTGVYRSTSELSYACAMAPTTDEGSGHGAGVLRKADTGTLMATVRAARRRQSMSATVVYNPAFYDAPESPTAATLPAINPAGQPYLHMTPENGFSLHSRQRPYPDPDVQ